MQMKWYEAQWDADARLRQRKHAVRRRLQIPHDALPGSLVLTHRRCGKPTCHCAQGDGHPLWFLTCMAEGKQRVEWIPAVGEEEIRPLVEPRREFRKAMARVVAAIAHLLARWRRQ